MYKFTSTPACSSTDPDYFFPEEGMKFYEQRATIERICNGCPVQSECLDYALHHVVSGFWAGTTEQQRQTIQKRQNIIPQELRFGF